MNKLAKDSGLPFLSKLPPIVDFLIPFRLRFYNPGWETNHIEGCYKGHNIHIYDLLFPKESSFFIREYVRFTIADIDGIEHRQLSWLGDLHLTPIYTLRKILSKLN
jgi:hypothetical protein